MRNKKPFIVAGIRNLLKRNYGIDPRTIDVEALVDSNLNFFENWSIIKDTIALQNIPYDFLRCHLCNKQVKADWVYCAFCGEILYGRK